jgi:hAT family C-terminal dimerisation region
MLLCHSNAASSFTDIITGGLLFLTLPVTVASAERSFSKLKLIKQYLRSTMSQLRLSSLAMLSIERLRAKTLDLDPLITRFATTKARCVDI